MGNGSAACMRLETFFALAVLEVLALVAIVQIPLVKDLITATGYSTGEVFSGIAAILLIFQTFIFGLTWRP